MLPQIAQPAARVGDAARPALRIARMALGEPPARVALRNAIRVKFLM
jgi:hypothetical protein